MRRSLIIGIGLVAIALVGSAPAQVDAGPRAARDVPAGLRDGPHDIVVNGVRLWYRVSGRGAPGAPPLVFLHGGPGQGSYHFAALVGPQLEPSLRIVYFDQRGSGRSERPWTREYAMSTLVEDVEGLRRALGVPQIALVAHSFGGALALEYAAKYPERVSSLVFAAGLWDAPTQFRLRCERINALYPGAAARVLGEPAASAAKEQRNCDWAFKLPRAEGEAINNALIFPDSAVRLRLDSVDAASGLRNTGELSAALFKAGLLQYRFAAPQRITMPVLVIAGRHDGTVVGDGLRELARLLPNATFLEYEKSGHFVYLDEPERFARDVVAFVTSRPGTKR